MLEEFTHRWLIEADGPGRGGGLDQPPYVPQVRPGHQVRPPSRWPLRPQHGHADIGRHQPGVVVGGYGQDDAPVVLQPAEEVGKGAPAILESGALDGVRAIFGGHVDRRFPVGQVVARRLRPVEQIRVLGVAGSVDGQAGDPRH